MNFFLSKWLIATLYSLNSCWTVPANATLRGGQIQAPIGPNTRVLQQQVTGTFLTADIQYHDDSGNPQFKMQNENAYGNRPDQTINIELQNGLIYTLSNIDPAWLHDKQKLLKSGKSKISIDKGVSLTGKNIDLNGGTPKAILKSGLFDRDLTESELDRNLAATGTRTVLAVRVVASDGEYTFTENELSDKVFGSYGDPVNLASQYAACSYNQLNFVKAADRSGLGTFISNGVVTISVATKTSEYDSAMREAVTTEIIRAFGVSHPSDLADHLMYCLPPNTMSGIAYAYAYSWLSVYSNEWCNYVSAQMHELGHNLGFGHSNEVSEPYGDRSGMMGYSYSSDNDPAMCFNSAKSFQSGWYATKTMVPSASDCGNFDGKIFGLSDFDGNVSGDRTIVVKIDDSRTGFPDYFVNYNKKTGINQGTEGGGDQVLITSSGNEGYSYSSSTQLAQLSVGEMHNIIDFEGTERNITITFNSIDTTTVPSPALISITYNGITCGFIRTNNPTRRPTSKRPTNRPTTKNPTNRPTNQPTSMRPTNRPTTKRPTNRPTTKRPTN